MKPMELLKKKSTLGLFISQATGAFNDNALKMILVGIVLATKPTEDHSLYLSLLNALLITPFILFSPAAGWLSDRFPKRNVLIIFKVTEFFILGIAIFALYMESLPILVFLLVLMGTQSAFYSPSKYGILKDLVKEKELGVINGIIEMGTITAIIAGTVGGALLYDIFKSPAGNSSLLIPMCTLGFISLCGLIYTTAIEKIPSRSDEAFSIKTFFKNMKEVGKSRKLKLTVIGITYFWFSAMLLNLLLILFGTQSMGLKTISQTSLLFLYLSAGVALGSYISARASRHNVETGLIPTGSIGMGVTSILLSFFAGNYMFVMIDLVLLGIFGGMFLIPLNTLLQLESGEDTRGKFIAITNMFTNIGMLSSSVVLYFFSSAIGFSPDTILILLGISSFSISIYIFFLLPESFFNFTLGILTHVIYKIKPVNADVVPESGGVLLTPNHMSFVDGLLLQYSIPHRKIRFVVYENFFNWLFVGWFLRMVGCIAISEKRAKDAIVKVSDSLRNGEVVCIFPEGSLTRIGLLLPFKKGVELILRKAPDDITVIPVCFDKLWGSIFSFKGGRYFWKIPERLPYPVTIIFGAPVPKDIKAFDLRQKVSELGAEACAMRTDNFKTLPLYFINTAKRFLFKRAVVDTAKKPLTYFRLLTSSILLSKKLNRSCKEEKMVGVILPASTAAVIANITIGLTGKTSVNLNFTSGKEAIEKAINKCSIKTILTSKLFLRKIKLKPMEQFVYMEDLAKEITFVSKFKISLFILCFPAAILQKLYCKKNASPKDLATIIFSSGSTGDPKGVMLSHSNVIANGEMVSQIMQLKSDDCMLGALPFFHSFGYTITCWLPLLKGLYTAYCPDPLDAKKVGEMIETYQSTLMLGTPTFYSLYTRGCKKEQFQSLRIAIAGAERLRPNIREAFEEKFKLTLLEGYGATEMAPVISCNVPDFSGKEQFQTGTKTGSVGLPLPGVSAKVVNLDNYDEQLPHGSEGMLCVSGLNQMIGYLDDEKRTADVLHDGWYITGDIAKFDEDGFIHIEGRLSRFSKIAGEMVPHIQIEDMINKVMKFDKMLLAVTAVNDDSKGEKLIVIHTPEAASSLVPKDVDKKLKEVGLPNLWIPKKFIEIEELPLLGSGKLDLKKLNTLAQDRICSNSHYGKNSQLSINRSQLTISLTQQKQLIKLTEK